MKNYSQSPAVRNSRSATVSNGASANFSRLTKLVCAGAALSLTPALHATLQGGNLLVNGSATAPFATGWTAIASGGQGWAIHTIPNTGGKSCFITSWQPCTRFQLVNLMPTGGIVTAADLDSSPEISVSEQIVGGDVVSYPNGAADKYYIKAQLLAADQTTVIKELSSGSSTSLLTVSTSTFDFATNTTKVVLKFASNSYPVGARYIRFEDGGQDSGNWAGNYGACFTDARVEYSQDTDGDGLPDVWELANGTNPNVPDADKDPDNDGLTNAQEFALGTAANNPDTDGDGLKDGVEDKTGLYYVDQDGKLHTGTDPLNPDTDGDGLLDGQEDYLHGGSDPNYADTDGDGFSDALEVRLGTDPRDSLSYPTFNYSTIMSENFDGGSVNSVYSLSHGDSGTYSATTASTGVTGYGNSLRINNGVSNVSNSLAFDQFPSTTTSVKVQFDFRITSGAADGLGFGFYRTVANATAPAYPATGPINPAFILADQLKWEDPSANAGVPNSVGFGFGIYNGSTFKMNGPVTPNAPLVTKTPTSGYSFSNGVFNRVVVTATSNTPGSTSFSLDITYDVNGTVNPPFTETLVSGVVAKGFDIAADPYRLVFGGRSGGSTEILDYDNILVSSTPVTAPKVAPVITSTSYTSGASPAYVINWKSAAGATYKVETSADLSTWTTVTGMATVASGGATTTASVPQAATLKKGFFRVTTN